MTGLQASGAGRAANAFNPVVLFALACLVILELRTASFWATALAQGPASNSTDALGRLLDFDGREIELPVLVVSSSLTAPSLEYRFSPSPVSMRLCFPEKWFTDLEELGSEQALAMREELLKYRAHYQKFGAIFDAGFMDALEGPAGYVVTFELAPKALTLIEETAELELVFQSDDGLGRWYKTR